MYRLIRPLLFALPAERAHRLGMAMLRLLGWLVPLCRWLRHGLVTHALPAPDHGPDRPPALTTCLGTLTLEHPIGLAAGLDKDGEALHGLFALGFAAVEVGTVTPLPQPGNPPPRLFRDPAHQALINRMGFNNHGVEAMAHALARQRWRPGALGINLGKNKDTPLERAAEDYVACAARMAPLADYLVLNASSPNTPGLRELQAPEHLHRMLEAVRKKVDEVAHGKPLFLKFAPDLADEAIDALVDVALSHGLTGLIATNTALTHVPGGAETAGLSGAPLRERSTQALRRAYRRGNGKLALWGVGGVASSEDVYEKIRAGASAVQVYTGLIYEGPGLVGDLIEGLMRLLRRDGFASVMDAIGADVRGEKHSP